MNKESRLLEIDALRGLAALGVVLFHYFVAFKGFYTYASTMFPPFRYFRYGKHGVAMFFIISGFFILMSLGRTRCISDFVVARVSRLYPVYWLAVILSFIIMKAANFFPFPGIPAGWKDALVNITMLQGFLGFTHIDGSYWTLSLELSFYAIMLAVYRAKLLDKIDVVVIVWLFVIAIYFLLEKQEILLVDSKIKILLLLDYAHLFIAGIALYRVHTQGFSIERYIALLGCCLFSLLKNGLEPTLFVILFISAFALALRGYLTFLKIKPLLFLGKISYSLYLIHLYPGLLIIRILEGLKVNLNIASLTALLSAILLATVLTLYVEKPAMSFVKNKHNGTGFLKGDC